MGIVRERRHRYGIEIDGNQTMTKHSRLSRDIRSINGRYLTEHGGEVRLEDALDCSTVIRQSGSTTR